MPDEELEDGSIIVDWTSPERVDALLRELSRGQYGMSGDTLDQAVWTIKALRAEVERLREFEALWGEHNEAALDW